tara:strand:- start:1691 stop:1990 length:300 start_codon:yes stop_codon:yes gene_type:complete
MNRYKSIPITRDLEGTRMYSTVKYPEIPRSNNDIYVITTDGDRYDVLAFTYFNDSSLWWVISIANAEYPQNSITPPVGVQLRIPGNLDSILVAYNKLNQ